MRTNKIRGSTVGPHILLPFSVITIWKQPRSSTCPQISDSASEPRAIRRRSSPSVVSMIKSIRSCSTCVAARRRCCGAAPALQIEDRSTMSGPAKRNFAAV